MQKAFISAGARGRTGPRSLLAAVALVTTTSFALAGCGAPEADRTPAGMATPGTTAQGAQQAGMAPLSAGDQQFVMTAMAGGKAEVELAELARDRASTDRVKELARVIEEAHGRANDELETIADRRDVTVGDGMHPGHEALEARLEGLKGPAFDRAYLDAMVEKHRKDIEAFTTAAQSSDPDIRMFAEKTLPTLRAHLAQAEAVQSGS